MSCSDGPTITDLAAPGQSSSKPSSSATRLKIAFGIAVTVLGAEVIGAFVTGSLALLIDAAHMATDVVGLLVALIAASLAKRPPTMRRTWGFARAEVLAATMQAAVLLVVGLFVLAESIHRLIAPTDVASGTLLWFGVLGLVGNIIAIAVLTGARHENFNLRAAFLEVVNDALSSLGVIAAAVLLALTGWSRVDPIAAILIGLLIIPRAIKLLRETTNVLLEATPVGLDLDDIRTHMLALTHVRAVHDLHATQVASGLPVLTAHVIIDAECFRDGHAPDILDALQRCVLDHFPISIEHSTFQLEPTAHLAHEGGTHQ